MHGKTVVVTGANSGIGEAAARALSQKGASVALVCRNIDRGEAACERIRSAVPGARVRVHRCDLSSLASVRTAAADLLENYPRVDVLINNAGLYLPERQATEDGLEVTVQTNHFGPFLLTQLLLERLKASAPARIVNVSSEAHRRGRLRFEDLQSQRRYRGLEVYGTSKLMNILHVRSLKNRLDPHQVTANALHPGVVATEFAQDQRSLFGGLFRVLSPLLKTPEQGARTTVYLASEPEAGRLSGQYFANQRPKTPSKDALDDTLAERLWTISESLTDAAAASGFSANSRS